MSQLPPGHRMPPKPKPKRRGTAGHAAKTGAQCGAKKRAGGKCTLAAGWGTSHPGIGKCRMHGGSVPNHIKNAARQIAGQMLGTPMDINPLDALLWCIKIKAGETKWLSEQMAELDEKDFVEDTIAGKQFHLYARERTKALKDLASFSQMAISLGIAERAVKLAEIYGETLARLIGGIMRDLEPFLSPEGKTQIPQIVRRHLILLDGGQDIEIEPPKKELAA